MRPYSHQVRNRIASTAAAALVVGGIAACSSEPPQANHPSQASITINGNTLASKQRVTCVQQQWYWTINIGDQKVSGATVSLDGSGDKLVAKSVHILNLGGFTGMYSVGDGGDADVNFSADTFTITGTAEGFNTDKPGERAKASFKIAATC